MKNTFGNAIEVKLGYRQSFRVGLYLPALLLLACALAAQAGDKFLPGHVPELPSDVQAIGDLEETNELRLAVGLELRTSDALRDFVETLYTPGNPSYQKYLTLAEFTETFAPDEKDEQAVVNYLQTNGLTIDKTFANRMIIDTHGPISAIERAFHVHMVRYRDSQTDRIFRAPTKNPQVPSTVPIADVSGLSDYGLPRVQSLIQPISNGTAIANGASGPGGTYSAADLRAAYTPSVTLNGAGQRVGVFSLGKFDQTDIANYERVNSISPVTVTPVLIDGYDGVNTYLPYHEETTADIEFAIAMAPGLTEVVVFEGPPDNAIMNDVLNTMVTRTPIVRQFTSSYSFSGGPTPTTDNIFLQMAAQGQTFFEASGDSGADWQGSYYNPNHFSVDSPSSTTCPQDNPFITLCGGTVLTTGPQGQWLSEQVWNECQGVASSGGHSDAYYAIPSWQQGVSMALNGGSTSFRNVPDISMVAWNVYYYSSWVGGDASFGGTSAAAPMLAGICALANQQAAAHGAPAAGFINPALYRSGRGFSAGQLFHDTVTGNNRTNCQYATSYSAVSGYDLCTGWGTPTGANTINLFAPIAITPPPGLVGWWKLDGNAQDSAFANNGSAEGTVTYVPVFVGSGLNFPNSGWPDVRIPNVAGKLNVGAGGGFTIEAWVSPADLAPRPIFEWNTGTQFGVHLWSSVTAAGTLYADIQDVNGVNHTFESSPSILVPNLLQHVALTYNKSSGMATIYLNGIQAAQSQVGSVTAQTTYDLWLGARYTGGTRWSGLMDEVSLYNRELSASEVWSIFAAQNQGKVCLSCSCFARPSGLVSWWGGDGSARDYQAQNDGVVQGHLVYTDGEVNNAFSMNGSDTDVKVQASASMNLGASSGFTIEGWIRPADNTMRPIVEWDSGSSYGVHFWSSVMSSGDLFANVVDTSGMNHILATGGNMTGIGLWHHVALTFDKASGTAIIYVDGAQIVQTNFGAIVPQTTYDMYIGARTVGVPLYRWLGALDEISIYNRTLSQPEIAGIFHALANGKCHY